MSLPIHSHARNLVSIANVHLLSIFFFRVQLFFSSQRVYNSYFSMLRLLFLKVFPYCDVIVDLSCTDSAM
ncbi:hypothetical protein V3C99_017517 [Haemonchus contortus]